MEKEFPDPKSELGVIKRYLHVLALLQNEDDKMNATKLADILSKDELSDSGVDGKTVRTYINEYLENRLGLVMDKKKGGRTTKLGRPLDEELLEDALNIYSSFVTDDSTRRVVLKNFMNKHRRDCLWMLARIYFATIEKSKISFKYTNTQGDKKELLVHPHHIVIRNNNIYLVAKMEKYEEELLFLLNQVEDLKISDSFFDDDIPPVEEIFKDTLGSFIGNKYDVKIKYDNSIKNQIDQVISILEPTESNVEGEDKSIASFTVSDEMYLCMRLFLYGDKVEILEPKEMRDTMIKMLEKSSKVYS
ncbi:WYL domain-containing protein [Spirochaetota bacterium]